MKGKITLKEISYIFVKFKNILIFCIIVYYSAILCKNIYYG